MYVCISLGVILHWSTELHRYPSSKIFYLLQQLGQGLELQHLRWNSECQVYEELPPIDFNPNYDFNYQQVTHIPKEVIVLPVNLFNLHDCDRKWGSEG